MYSKGDIPVPGTGFRLVRLLGRGGFGEVWKATGPGGTEAAIKIISLGDGHGLKEFRAIHLVKQVRHPNLVPILGFWLKDEAGNLLDDHPPTHSMPRIQAAELLIALGLGDKNLLDRLKECQREGKTGIPRGELLDYMEDAARAIDHLNQPAHELGSGPVAIQHCDIKPQNILIVSGAAQVCDFGLARVLEDTRVSGGTGTLGYMAPELLNQSKPSRSTDQYSLALTYVELRTGALPLNASVPADAIQAHIKGTLDFSRLSEAEQGVLKRATALDPEARYPTTLDMVRALREADGPGSSVRRRARPMNLEEVKRPGWEIVPGYRLVRQLGRGSYGEVWEATAPGGKHIALKIIGNLEGISGRQEFKALELIKGVEHLHLMELHAYWLLDEFGEVIPDEVRDRPDAPRPWMLVIASRLANMNLMQRLQECRRAGLHGIPLPELLGYLRQAAQAIDYLNSPQHGTSVPHVSIQHRDIKPENILLAAGAVKVGDFSLAKVVEGTQAAIRPDSWGLTVAYAAPEMFSGKVTAWSDQYSLALTYFKLRTGTFPFPEKAPLVVIVNTHCDGKLDLSALPEPERSVLARATRLKPDKRFPDCQSLARALETACGLAGSDSAAPSSRIVETPSSVPPAVSHSAVTLIPAPVSGPAATAVVEEVASAPTDAKAETAVPAAPGANAAPTIDYRLPGELSGPHAERTIPLPAVQPGAQPSASTSVMPAPWRPKKLRVRRGPVVAGVCVVTMVAGLAVACAVFSRRAEEAAAHVQEAIAAEDYAGALDLLDGSVFLIGRKTPLRDWALVAWRSSALRDYGNQHYGSALEKAEAILGRFPDDSSATHLRRLALQQTISPKLHELIEQGAYPQALAYLEQERAALPDGGSEFREMVKTAWCNAAREHMSQKRYLEAVKRARELVKHFPNDVETAKLETGALLAFHGSLVEILENADQQLDQNPRQARAYYETVLHSELIEQFTGLKQRAQLGRARAAARSRAWPEVIDFHNQVPLSKLQGSDMSISVALNSLRLADWSDARMDSLELLKLLRTNRLPEDKLADLPPDSWEDREIAKLEAQVLNSLSSRLQGMVPDQAVALADRLLGLNRQHFETLYWKAAKLIENKDHKAALATIEAARKVADAKGRQRLEALANQVKLASATSSFKTLFEEAQALLRKGDFEGSLAKLKGAEEAGKLDPNLGKEVIELRREVYSELVKGMLVNASQIDTLNFSVLCDQAKPTGWVHAGRAEYLLEKSFTEIGSVRQALEKQALEDSADPNVAETGGYGHYIRGLVYWSTKKATPEESGQELLKAFAGDAGLVVGSGHRRVRAIAAFQDIAKQLREGGSRTQPFPTKAHADHAYQCLRKAQELLEKDKKVLPLESRVRLAFAAWHKPTPDEELARSLSTALTAGSLENINPTYVYVLRMIAAQTNEATDLKTAFARYSQIVELQRDTKPIKLDPREFYADVLAPAIAAGEKLRGPKPGAASEKQLARLYADKGQLLREHRYDFPKEQRQEAYVAYDKAVQLDPQEARYLVHRAYARQDLPQPDWKTSKADAQRAITLNTDYPGGLALLGYLTLLEARGERRDRAGSLKAYQQALDALGKAEQLCAHGDSDRLLPIILLNRSQVHLELGNYLTDPEIGKQHLQKALADAERATKLNRAHPEWAFEALGNALEDTAMFAGETANYGAALRAFTQAIKLQPARGTSRIARGRCQYRMVALGKQPADLTEADELLKEAVADLETGQGQSANRWEAAEAAYWIGKIGHYRGERDQANRSRWFEQARSALQQVLDLHAKLKTVDTLEWNENSLEALVQMGIAEAKGQWLKKPAEAEKSLAAASAWAKQLQATNSTKAVPLQKEIFQSRAQLAFDELLAANPTDPSKPVALLKAARHCAQELTSLGDPSGAALILAQCQELEGEPAKALITYDETLRIPGVEKSSSYFLLLNSRVNLLITHFNKLNPKPEELIKEADRVAQVVTDPSFKAEALANTGLARSAAAALKANARYEQEAIERLRQAVKAAPEHRNAWLWHLELGELLAKHKSINEARQHFREALKGPYAQPHAERIQKRLNSLKD